MNRPIVSQRWILPAAVTLLTLGLSACQRVVSIDLNKADPHIVIEGVVTDGPGPYTVSITKTGSYFEPALVFPTVSGATVVLSDNAGTSDTLQETLPGKYVSSHLTGVEGRTYHLSVMAEGKEYDGSSVMPSKVRIDSVYTTVLRAPDGDRGYNIFVQFKDPPVQGNYYRVIVHTNLMPPDSVTGQRYLLVSDKLLNGNEATYQIRARRNIDPGDTLTVALLSVDRATYDYYTTLRNILSFDRSPTALAPANPNTNLSNGSLGYFAALTGDSVRVVLR